jgi:hypothetical protein
VERNRIFTGAQRGRLYDLHGVGSPATDDHFRYTLHNWWGKARVELHPSGTRLQRVCTLPVADIPRYSLDWFGTFASRVPVANPMLLAIRIWYGEGDSNSQIYRVLNPARLPISPSPQTAIRCQEFGGWCWIRTNVAFTTDLQSVPIDRSGNHPNCALVYRMYNDAIILSGYLTISK